MCEALCGEVASIYQTLEVMMEGVTLFDGVVNVEIRASLRNNRQCSLSKMLSFSARGVSEDSKSSTLCVRTKT